MRICIVAEGCYPYIVGGVSSWIQSLIRHCPDHEFSIIAINPEQINRGKFKYSLPENVVDVHEVFLDERLQAKGKWNKSIKLSKEAHQALNDLLNNTEVDWKILFDLINPKARFTAVDLILSKKFYKLIQESYGDKYAHIPFTDVFWTLRSMYITLFSLMETAYMEADVYHSVSTGYAGVVAACASYAHDKPLLLTEHGIYTREREEELIKSDWVQGHFKDIWIDYFKNLSNSIYTQADQVVTLFERNKTIQVELGCDRKKIEVIHNGIDVSRFKDVGVIKKKEGSPLVVAGIVRVVPIKDVMTMLQAFSVVNASVANVEFLIIGPLDEHKAYYEECLAYMHSLGLKNVTFTGRVDVKDYLARIDVHVLTSISEGQPLTILETLANKIPNVTTNVGDCMSLLLGEDSTDHFGPAGFVESVMDFNGLGHAIIKLLRDKALRKNYGENGYRRVKARYDFDDFIDRYQEIYQRLKDRR